MTDLRPFDHTKPCRTRSGLEVREVHQFSASLIGGETIMAVVVDARGCSALRSYFSDGRYVQHVDGDFDLVNIPAKRWLNVYPNGSASVFRSREEADRWAASHRIACLEFSEGDGL